MPLSRLQPFLAVVLGGQALANMDNAIVNVATPAIGATIHAGGAALQLTIAAYVLVSAALLVPSARLGTVAGQRRMFRLGLVVFTLASLCCGLAPNATALIAARMVQGAGAALMVAQVLSAIQRHIPDSHLPGAIASYTLTLSLSGIAGQLLGGALIAANIFGWSWRPLFLINVPVGIALFFLAGRVLPPDPREPNVRADIDGAGALALVAAMVLFVLPLTIGRELGWPPWAIASLIASVPAALAFVWWERQVARRTRRPLVDLELFATPAIRYGIIALTGARLTYFSLLFVLAQYVQTGRHESAFASGALLAVWAVGYGSAAPVFPRVPARAGAWFAPLGCTLMLVAYSAIALLTSRASGDVIVLAALLGCGGFGFGCMSTASMSLLTRTVAKEHAADLSGVLSTLVPLATVVGVSTFGTLYLLLATRPAAAFATVCWTFAATSALAAIAALAARRVPTAALSPAAGA